MAVLALPVHVVAVVAEVAVIALLAVIALEAFPEISIFHVPCALYPDALA